MKIFNILESFVQRMLSCFALIVVLVTFFGNLLGGENFVMALTISQIFTFFWFSALFSLSCEIANLIKNGTVIQGAVRFLLSLVSFVLLFFFSDSFSMYLSQKQNKAYSVFVITFFYIIIYVVCSLLFSLIKFIKNKVENSSKEYQEVFNK